MDYRTRRIEQRRQQRLGCFILLTAAGAGIILATIVMSVLPPIPIVATIAFYSLVIAIAAGIERGMRRLLGYNPRKASLQSLRSDTPDVPQFSSPASPIQAESNDAADGSAATERERSSPQPGTGNSPAVGIPPPLYSLL